MTSPPPALPEEDYEAIEAAVMDTARGRWFLAEFARRNRSADTAVLLAAIDRLENMIGAAALNAVDKPHAPVHTGIATSASAELFAIEAPPPASESPANIPVAGLPDDGNSAWVIEDHPEPAPEVAEVFEIDDENLIWPHEVTEVPPLAEEAIANIPSPSAQNRMLSGALAAHGTNRAADAPAPPAVVGQSPPVVDFATLDALSFEEKTVYFA